jgi:hypothetical protein
LEIIRKPRYVKRWGEWVLGETRKEIRRFYPSEPDGSIPVGYILVRIVICYNPACSTEILVYDYKI